MANILRALTMNIWSFTEPYAARMALLRQAVAALVGPLLVVCAVPTWEVNVGYERELQAVAMAQLVERHADPMGFPPIIGGDFDATPDCASIRFLAGKQSLAGTSVHFRDAWAEA